MSHWTNSLKYIGACEDAVEWCARFDSIELAWAACERADWALWLIGRLAGQVGDPRRVPLALCAADCAETALRFVPAGEDRRRQCIETVHAWARGEATAKDVRIARRAIADDVYTDCATSAAYYAATAVDAAYATSVTGAAAYAAAGDNAQEEALADMMQIVRQYYPSPPALPEAT